MCAVHVPPASRENGRLHNITIVHGLKTYRRPGCWLAKLYLVVVLRVLVLVALVLLFICVHFSRRGCSFASSFFSAVCSHRYRHHWVTVVFVAINLARFLGGLYRFTIFGAFVCPMLADILDTNFGPTVRTSFGSTVGTRFWGGRSAQRLEFGTMFGTHYRHVFGTRFPSPARSC